MYQKSIRYIADHFRYLTTPAKYGGIDALRTVAIVLVLLFHFNIPGLRFGWVGVDLFFVLSGFLIGGAIIRQLQRDKPFSFAEFYVQRALRILPLYYATILFCVVTFALPRGSSIWPDILVPLTFLQTAAPYYFGLQFNQALGPQGTWSLAIEAQFYIIAPILMLTAHKLNPRWGVISLCVIAIASAPIIRASFLSAFAPDDVNWHFASSVQFHSRYDTLAWGALIAVISPKLVLTRFMKEILATASLLLFAAFISMLLQTGQYWDMPQTITRELVWVPSILGMCFGTAVLLLQNVRVDSPFVIFIARISYPLYLSHFYLVGAKAIWPEWSLLDLPFDNFGLTGGTLIIVALTVPVAYLLSLLVEFPFLRMYKPDLGKPVETQRLTNGVVQAP